jgi:hypothetical protein
MSERIKMNIPGKNASTTAGKKRDMFFLQARLSINPSNDIYEQEADAMADKAMRMTDSDIGQTRFFKPVVLPIQRKCSFCEEEEQKISRKEIDDRETAGYSGLDKYVESLTNSGQSLSSEERNFYEPRLGYDFANVKVHTDTVAAKSAQSINALAFTTGNHIVFNAGQYSPGTDSGKKLLGHELTHVIQQGSAGVSGSVQKKVIDDATHLPCRTTRPTAFAEIQSLEQKAISLCRGAAQKLKQFVPSHTGATESAATHDMRDILWRRLKLNYNRFGRCVLVPALAEKFTTVANNIANTEYTYPCAGPGIEPPGECTTQPNKGNAWTAKGTANTELCDSFWGRDEANMTRTIIHEFFHYSFGMGDCPEAAPDDNPTCYALLASEMGGVAGVGDTHGGCCAVPADPLPAADITSFDQDCPSGLTLHFPILGAGYSYATGSGGHGMIESVGIDLGIPLGAASKWELTLGGRFTMTDSLSGDNKTSYLLGLRAGAQLRSRPWRDGLLFGGFLEAGGAFNVPDKTGKEDKGHYLGGGIKLGAAISLSKDKALSLFTEFTAGNVNVNDNTLHLFTAGAGISVDW